jgi:hypothetical protein
MKKNPGTSGLMPVKGSGCGIRPDTEKMEDSEGFDFSAAAKLLQENKASEDATEPPRHSLHPLQTEHGPTQHPASTSEDQSSPEPRE